jgi:hypothetical protein
MQLPSAASAAILSTMFVVTEADAAAIRAAYEQGGQLSAVVELRRLSPGLATNENARICARSIAGWTPPALPAAAVTPQRPRKKRL